MSLVADGLSTVFDLLAVDDAARMLVACKSWSRNPFGQKSVHLARVADMVVTRIKETSHSVRKRPRESDLALADKPNIERETYKVDVVDENMDQEKFQLLFGRNAGVKKPDDSVEVQFHQPADMLAAFPSLPPAVENVHNDAPVLPLCPLRCWAGYAGGEARYDPKRARFTLTVRSRVLKVGGYWEKTLDSAFLNQYLFANV
jgi:hypothetical protein